MSVLALLLASLSLTEAARQYVFPIEIVAAKKTDPTIFQRRVHFLMSTFENKGSVFEKQTP